MFYGAEFFGTGQMHGSALPLLRHNRGRYGLVEQASYGLAKDRGF